MLDEIVELVGGSRLRVPVSQRGSSISRRTVMNHAG